MDIVVTLPKQLTIKQWVDFFGELGDKYGLSCPLTLSPESVGIIENIERKRNDRKNTMSGKGSWDWNPTDNDKAK